MVSILDTSHSCIFVIVVFVMGKMIEISMSKIKNRIPIMKKCDENGFRADDKRENPHSNGVFFSRLIFVFLEIRMVKQNTIMIIFTKIIVVHAIFITLLKFNLLIGSQLYFLY